MLFSLRKLFDDRVPPAARVADVSARDGLQSFPRPLPPEVRAHWIRALLSSGIPEVEAGSFVSEARVPQMAGTAKVLELLANEEERLWVLVPNLRGLEQAAEAGARNVVCLASATETHSLANLGRPIARVLADLEHLAARGRALGLRARASLSMAWVDPTEGAVPVARVLEIARALQTMGIEELTLCDTYGGASPRAVAALLEAAAEIYPVPSLGLHLHNTFGTASANSLVGLFSGVTRFEASVGGLGGCPFAPGALGNMDTEHLVALLRSLDVETGIDLDALGRAARVCLGLLGHPGHVG